MYFTTVIVCDKIPPEVDRKAVKGKKKFSLEIVEVAVGYAASATYQLSSFINYPPTELNLQLCDRFYAEEDIRETHWTSLN